MSGVVCPNCGYEGCYNNGTSYECPSCDLRWEYGLVDDFVRVVWRSDDGQIYDEDEYEPCNAYGCTY